MDGEKLRKILFGVYQEGFKSGIAKSDKHDFDVVEEALNQIKRLLKPKLSPDERRHYERILEELGGARFYDE